MDVDPMEAVEAAEEESNRERSKNRLNSIVAIAVAILATFMGICKVKDDNICQAMQQAQAKSIDSWAWYQSKKTRLLFAQATVDQMEIQALTAAPNVKSVLEKKVATYKGEVERQTKELTDVQEQAKGYDKDYDSLNLHDDQFDLSDALLAIAISLLAVTSLTQKRWLFYISLVPILFGVVYGMAGLLNLQIHSNFFAKLLGT